MVNSKDFGERIQKLMDYYQLSASAFADAIDTGRSSISHILSGRNKPSLDFILKITDTYPEVDIYWLLNGKGVFPKDEKSHATPPAPDTNAPHTTEENPDTTHKPQDLFSNTETTETEKKDILDIQESIIRGAKEELNKPKTIRQIIVFYTDGTFELFKN